MTIYIRKALHTTLIISLMLLFAKTLRTAMMCRPYVFGKFTADAILFREIQCRKIKLKQNSNYKYIGTTFMKNNHFLFLRKLAPGFAIKQDSNLPYQL